MKIAVCGLINSENLGEKFISRSLAWIIANELKNHGHHGRISFIEADIEAKVMPKTPYKGFISRRRSTYCGYSLIGVPGDILYSALKKIADKMPSIFLSNCIHRLRRVIWLTGRNQKKRIRKYMLNKFKGAEMIVIDGAGLLEYSRNEYQELLLLITELGDELGLPVVCNAIGRAGTIDERDFRYSILKRAFACESVKYVSARDSREIVQQVVGSRFDVKLLADAAFCLDLAYGIKSASVKGLVGIGLIRGNALTGYGEDLGEDALISLFCNVANELTKRGYRYRFFTNGMIEDIALGKKVIERLGCDSSLLIERPTRPEELLETISKFEGLITCRMHSSIAAFTMGIPSVILSWNVKVDEYMRSIGYPERSIKPTDLNAKFIVDSYEKALHDGITDEKRLLMREKAIESVDGYIDIIEYNHK